MSMFDISDYRRAAALIQHHGAGSLDGMNAVVDEANEADRTTHLLYSLLAIYQEIVPELRTDLGMSLMSSYIYKLAGAEQSE
ncbi:hypothetical protein V2J52_13285 [Georgenia sp. MJ173]|uniref:hypothetical protein n=1 Tax=Georgenia sunbinii TaxID=3117728 RepID=UPI002F267C8C